MRIALCLEYPIQQAGGTEVLVRELIEGLAARHEIALVSNDSPSIKYDPGLKGKIVAHLPWDPTALTFDTSRQLARDLAGLGVNLVHFHFGGNYSWGSRRPNLCPAIHVRRLNVPCLVTNHGVFGLFDGYIGPQRGMGLKLALLPFAWASRLQVIMSIGAEVAVSQNDYVALRRRYWPVRGKFRQIYHSRIREGELLQPRSRTKTILCAGTVGARKGQPYLCAAFAQLASEFSDWNLLLIGRPGDDETVDQVQRAIDRPEVRGRITWIRECSDMQLREWFQSVEIFAMPSLHEGLGLTLQEALYYGCACIASRIGGIQDLIEHETNGILVKRANADDLARGLTRLMTDGALRQRLHERGRQSVLAKNMTSERMIAQYEQLYQELEGMTPATLW